MQSENARNEILASVRRNLANSAPFDVVHNEHHARQRSLPIFNSGVVSASDLQNVSLVERFKENLVSIGGNCEIVGSLKDAAAFVQTIIKDKKLKRIALSDSFAAKQIGETLKTDVEILENAAAAKLFDCDLGITGAQFGIAETGTLVLESDREFSRLTSLVPPIHVCLLFASLIKQTLGETLELLEKDLSRTITFITGPSRTSDIELTLAIGVHGPAELYVILIEETADNGQ